MRGSFANLDCKNDDKLRLVLITISNSIRDGLDRVLLVYWEHQAFVFVTLSMVYMSHKIEVEE